MHTREEKEPGGTERLQKDFLKEVKPSQKLTDRGQHSESILSDSEEAFISTLQLRETWTQHLLKGADV